MKTTDPEAVAHYEARLAYYDSDEYHQLFLTGRVTYPEVAREVTVRKLAEARAHQAKREA